MRHSDGATGWVDIEILLLNLVVMIVFGTIIVLANYADLHQSIARRQIVSAILMMLNLLFVGYVLIIPTSSDIQFTYSSLEWLAAFLIALMVAGLATAFQFYSVRARIGRLFPRARPTASAPVFPPPTITPPALLAAEPGGTPLFPQMLNYYTTESVRTMPPASVPPAAESFSPGIYDRDQSMRGFDPGSTVHMVALVFALYLIGNTFVNFLLSGGLGGVAESFSQGISIWDLSFNWVLFVAIPVLGVGLGIRRNLSQTLRRLGLTNITMEEVGVVIAATIGLLVFVYMMSAIWQFSVSEETFKEQTEASDALAESIDTVLLAFLLAFTAGVTEEIAFRGALQPVIGFWPTAILFTLTHIQYTLTPASLIILVVAITFGWLRQRYNTTVAILTHFLYDFIPLALFVIFSQEAILRLL